MSKPRVYPSREELKASPRALNAGELAVLNFFEDNLSPDWKIFVEPHLNGLRPDLVLLHPRHGIAVFEVKDWNLSAVTYRYEGAPLRLRGRLRASGETIQARDPIRQVRAYKDEICHLYCPSLLGSDTRGFGVVTAGIIFPRASSEQLDALYDERVRDALKFSVKYPQNVLVGREALKNGPIDHVFPLVHQSNPLMTEEIYQELLAWLVPPEFAVEQGRPLTLDPRQRALVMGRTETGFRRVKGPAGSGKSLVLAARAAQLVKKGKRDVLVVSYNIMLKNYLRDLASRWHRPEMSTSVSWLNYHKWAKLVCLRHGRRRQYSALWAHHDHEEVWATRLPALVEKILADDPETLRRYDAILVDEGQDFQLSWWSSLRAALRPGGEMLLVADHTQDLYGTAPAWTDEAMRGAGFRGPWVTLETNHRLPEGLIPHVKRFADHFLPAESAPALPESSQGQLLPEHLGLRWVQADSAHVIDALERAVLSLPFQTTPGELAWADIVLLVFQNALGQQVVSRLAAHGFKTLHTFDDDEEGQRARSKHSFYKGRERLKATTVHSFKGWEGRALIIHIPAGVLREPHLVAAAYVALTRLKSSARGALLTVVCDEPALEAYGHTWPCFERWSPTTPEPVSDTLRAFPAYWRPLIFALQTLDMTKITPSDDARIIATLHNERGTLHLIDSSQPTSVRLVEALEDAGHDVYELHSDGGDPSKLALDLLEELEQLGEA